MHEPTIGVDLGAGHRFRVSSDTQACILTASRPNLRKFLVPFMWTKYTFIQLRVSTSGGDTRLQAKDP